MADLTGRALDAAVAERVMGWELSSQDDIPAWFIGDESIILDGDWQPSISYDACQMLRAEIERRGLRGHFVYALAKQLGFSFEIEPFDEIAVWMFLNATPEQQCRAALRAMEGAHA